MMTCLHLSYFSKNLKDGNSKANSDRPSTCAKAVAECDEELFPNIYVLLVIACTIPVM